MRCRAPTIFASNATPASGWPSLLEPEGSRSGECNGGSTAVALRHGSQILDATLRARGLGGSPARDGDVRVRQRGAGSRRRGPDGRPCRRTLPDRERDGHRCPAGRRRHRPPLGGSPERPRGYGAADGSGRGRRRGQCARRHAPVAGREERRRWDCRASAGFRGQPQRHIEDGRDPADERGPERQPGRRRDAPRPRGRRERGGARTRADRADVGGGPAACRRRAPAGRARRGPARPHAGLGTAREHRRQHQYERELPHAARRLDGAALRGAQRRPGDGARAGRGRGRCRRHGGGGHQRPRHRRPQRSRAARRLPAGGGRRPERRGRRLHRVACRDAPRSGGTGRGAPGARGRPGRDRRARDAGPALQRRLQHPPPGRRGEYLLARGALRRARYPAGAGRVGCRPARRTRQPVVLVEGGHGCPADLPGRQAQPRRRTGFRGAHRPGGVDAGPRAHRPRPRGWM